MTRGSSPLKAEGGHAVGRGVAMEHQGTGAHSWVALDQPETALGGTACACAMRRGGAPAMANCNCGEAGKRGASERRVVVEA